MFFLTITCTSNNYFLSLKKEKKNILFWASAGTCSFRGSKKHSPLLCETIVTKLVTKIMDNNIKLKKLEIDIHGIGSNLFLILYQLDRNVKSIKKIIFKKKIPHNGCRNVKTRRL